MNDWKSSINPGEIIADELEEIDLTISQLAQKIYVSPETLYHIVQGDANLTGDIALKLGGFFNTGVELWMNWLFSTLCDNFCLWNREMLTEKDFYDYFAEETISIGFVSTQKPEEP